MMRHLYSAFSISKLFYHFVGDFGQTASKSLQFIDEILQVFPYLGIFGNKARPKQWELHSQEYSTRL